MQIAGPTVPYPSPCIKNRHGSYVFVSLAYITILPVLLVHVHAIVSPAQIDRAAPYSIDKEEPSTVLVPPLDRLIGGCCFVRSHDHHGHH